MKLEEIKTKEDLANYTKGYGYHIVFCLFDHCGIRKLGDYHYMFSLYKDKHRANWYNDSKISEKECTLEECVDLIKNEVRKTKLKKICSKLAIE